MFTFKVSFKTFLALMLFSLLYGKEGDNLVPGKSYSDQIYYTDLGEGHLYFFMSPEKKSLAKDFLVKSIHHNNVMLTTVSIAKGMNKILPMASKYSDSIRHIMDDSSVTGEREGRPKYPDPIGHQIINTYIAEQKTITEKLLNIDIQGPSRYLNLNINQDTAFLEKEAFKQQREYLKKLSSEKASSPYFFHEVDLIAWQMAPATFSAYLVEEEGNHDRFLMTLFPEEMLSMAYAIPAKASERSFLQAALAPMDYLGNYSVGSWKGKSIHTGLKGVITQQEVENLNKRATFVPINKPTISHEKDLKCVAYGNGIVMKQLSREIPSFASKKCHRMEDQENLTVLEVSPKEYEPIIGAVKDCFVLKRPLSQVFSLIKNDGGFSKFETLFHEVPDSAEVVLLNRSHFPKNYSSNIISEDTTVSGTPWIQMYNLLPEMAMKIDGKTLKKLSLSPVEEILFRKSEQGQKDQKELVEKLVVQVDVLVFKR